MDRWMDMVLVMKVGVCLSSACISGGSMDGYGFGDESGCLFKLAKEAGMPNVQSKLSLRLPTTLSS